MKVLRVLLAEDNRGDILLVEQALNQHCIHYELYLAKDGEEALEFVDRMGKPGEVSYPDVVLLDLNLPKVDGPKVLSYFRKNPACLTTPVIVVTSSDAPSDRALMATLGVAHYFRKPSDFDAFMELGAVVRNVIAGQYE